MIELLNIDCIEYMKSCKDNSFDLAIVDPQTGQGEGKKHLTRPYIVKQNNGSKISVKRTHHISEWDSEAPPQEYYDQLFRVSKHQIIMCENYLHFNQKSTSEGRIIWNLLRDNDFSACQIMWTSLTNKIEYFEYLWSGMIQGEAINSRRQIGNKKLNEKRIHPSQKPIKVYRKLLNDYAIPGMKILDTHLGSASIAIACDELGFDLVACEVDKVNYLKAIKRYADKKRELVLAV